ncbi:MAG TPA: hypothetical protein VLS93_05515 [Anaeromyxobacteraceae bacterium]|nr:hypothetical protein [Anaeromyxobacteraceae bacterium]
MTDLAGVPEGAAEVARLYHELAALGARVEGRRARWRFGRPSPEETLVLAAQASRREPRLLWALVELLARAYDRFDALRLRRAAARARWPAAVAVALEFARRAAPSEELDAWAHLVTSAVAPARGERFFLGTRAFAGEQARRDAEESLAEYLRWGYLGREEPFAKELGLRAHGTLGPAERRNLLRRIASRRGAVTLAEYLEVLGGRASARQASRDLAAADFLVREGRTRGSRWRHVGEEGRKR